MASLLLLLLLLLFPPIQSTQAVAEPVQWEILTKANYSSEIRRHPHILLMITVPWCGESRALKRELANAVTGEPERFSTLKLMLVYRNNERTLANALGASEEITFLYFHHSVSYKYGGRLRVRNLLSSVRYVMSLQPGELPVKFLNTPDELRSFLDSSDKVLLLFDFCGWTPRLLSKGLIEETNGTQVWEEKKQKAVEDNKMSCNVHDGFSPFPAYGEVIMRNDGSLPEENMTSGDGFSCTLEGLHRLESFFPTFIKLVRDFFLPPERLSFGVVSERSLISDSDFNASAPWLMKLYSANCPSCSQILGEGDDLKVALETQDSFIKEIKDNLHDVSAALPASQPSVLLFIDRSSESLSIREKSKEALDVFRKLALQFQNSNQNCVALEKSNYEYFQEMSPSKITRPKSFLESQRLKLKNKLSIMIANDGRQISLENFISDLQGGPLHEVLANLLQDKNKSKFSSLAKDAGFQLLSDDFDIKGTHDVNDEPEHQSNQALGLSPDVNLRDTANQDEGSKLQSSSTSTIIEDEENKLTETEYLELVDDGNSIGKTEESSEKFASFHTSKVVLYSDVGKSEDTRLPSKNVRSRQEKDHSVSFYLCDGHFRLYNSLTAANLRIPSVVIVNPVMQEHFILPENEVFNFPSLSDFLHAFLNGSLLPYQQSQLVVQSQREAAVPPFVNLDFHEMESIPLVTAYTFADMVIGDESDSMVGNAWDADVVVLFTNGWCGFCQRMEMVVREAFRTIKGYTNMVRIGSTIENFVSSKEPAEVFMRIPLFYLMDCTLNDCSLILKSIVKREIYPSLVLFPAGRKNAVLYEGEVAVYDVIKFLSDHETLANEKGVPWVQVEQGESVPSYQSMYHEVLLKDKIRETVATENRGHSLSGSLKSIPQVVVGSILTATEKLITVHTFDESRILIVKADKATGFEGLILNKHILWDSLEELDANLRVMKEAPLSYGGPVMKQGMPLVSLARKSVNDDDKHLEVLPGVHLLDQWATLQLMEELKLGNGSIHGYWFFLGFSSWGWEQLFHEIAEGAWDVSVGTAIDQLDWPEIS